MSLRAEYSTVCSIRNPFDRGTRGFAFTSILLLFYYLPCTSEKGSSELTRAHMYTCMYNRKAFLFFGDGISHY